MNRTRLFKQPKVTENSVVRQMQLKKPTAEKEKKVPQKAMLTAIEKIQIISNICPAIYEDSVKPIIHVKFI